MAERTVFDCYCGVGGLSLGAQMAGYRVLGGVDADPVAVKSYEGVFPDALALCEDLLKRPAADVLKKAGIARGDVDVLLGGPPCQPFSVYNHQRGTTDGRSSLVGRFLDFAGVLKPRWVLMENVQGLLSVDGGAFLEGIVKSLRARGYRAAYCVLDASSLGVPQKRHRLVLLGSRERTDPGEVLLALRSRQRCQATVGDAIADLPEETADPSPYATQPSNDFQKAMRQGTNGTVTAHLCGNLSPINQKRLTYIPQGGNWRKIPRRLLPAGMKRARRSDHTTRYGRLDPAKPAFTILTRCTPHWSCVVHPSRDRVLTVRETARLQSIPDHVAFHGSLTDQYRHVGNAVPPLMAKAILEEMIP
jgi:DNA (cytosine-5)-methyltransferase 1